jgi:predicted unusual protein kinase regulating ubiquinone biosynthesis (AarF/ABC1/UbiB family)
MRLTREREGIRTRHGGRFRKRQTRGVIGTRALRTARLLALPLGALALSVEGGLRRLSGQEPAAVRRRLRARNAARTRRTLADLKGGALKAGQLLSTVEMLFPQDPEDTWRETLIGLQEQGTPVPFGTLEPVLRDDMGPHWKRSFHHLDHHPVAAASIGQVHRGTWRDGRDVAVKVQYPGIREAIGADLRTLSAMSRLAALVARGLAMPPLIRELRVRLVQELDYEHEAAAQRRFAAAYVDDADVLIPGVVAATSRVLVTDWLEGTPIARVAQQASTAHRDRAGLLYSRFILGGPTRAGMLHSDPHPGNFRLTSDGRLGVLDFGSTLEMPGGMPSTFGRLIAVLMRGDEVQILRGLREEGFLAPERTINARKLADYLAPFTEPARHEVFHFTRDWLRSEFGRVNDPRNPDFAVALQLSMPAEHLFTHRVWLGCIGVLCQLGATVAIGPELRRYLPSFTSSA